MSVMDWSGLAVAVITVLTGFTAAIRWLVQHYLSELKPNSGSSMRDAVNINTKRLERVEEEQSRQSNRIDDIYKLLCEIKGK